jgi:hypothetical protein
VLALGACSSPAASVPLSPTETAPTLGASTGPSTAPEQSANPSATASGPSAKPAVGTIAVFPPGAAVAVTVAELNIRNGPATSAKRLVTLKRGDVLVIGPTEMLFGWGPVRAGGYTWYPVIRPGSGTTAWTLAPLPNPAVDPDAETALTGWVAADNGTSAYVTAVAPRCPSTIDLLNVAAMLPAERIGCFHEPIVIEGTFGCGGCGGATTGTYEPAWLASPMNFDFLSVDPSIRTGPVALNFPPDGPARPASGTIIRVTVHVDDPRSLGCVMSELGDGDVLVPIDHDTAVYFCRERLVVDSYEVIAIGPPLTG